MYVILFYRFENGVMANLEEHLKIGHICLTNLSCRACHWKSSELPALVNHVMKEHSKLICFTCINCQASFHSQNELEKHRKQKHLLFKCALCEFATDLDSTLVSHVETKHSDSSLAEVITDYRCPVCLESGIQFVGVDPVELSGM